MIDMRHLHILMTILFTSLLQLGAIFIGIGWFAEVERSVLQECIEYHTNEPYWNRDNYKINQDLRNPRFNAELDAVFGQFELTKSDILKITRG